MKPATPKPTRTRKPHVAIIGSGLAGLSAALWAAQTQARVTLLTKGIGGLLLSNGTIDILGFQTSPDGSETLAENPFDGLEHLPKTHPYRVIGTENLQRGLDAFLAKTDCLQVPAPNRNVFSPSPAGSARPTYALPHTGLVLKDGMKLLVVGLEQFKDFPAQLIADNLARSEHARLQARAMLVDLPGRGQEADVNATDYARSFDSPRGAEMLGRLAQDINAQVLPGEVVLVPALVGLRSSTFSEFAAQVAAPVYEVPTVPPSIWGRRLYDHLLEKLRAARVDIRLNCEVSAARVEDGQVRTLDVARAGGVDVLKVDAVIDAAGGFASGNLRRDSWMSFSEAIFGLPLFSVQPPLIQGIHEIDSENRREIERVLSTGVRVNAQMNPVDATGKVIAANLYCVGELIAGGAPWRELSGEGIALGSAWAAIQAAKTQLGLGGEKAGTTPPTKTATSGAGQAGGLEPGNDGGNLEPGHNPTPKRKRTGKNHTNTTKTAQKEAAK